MKNFLMVLGSLFLFLQLNIARGFSQEIPAFFRVHDLTQTLSEQDKSLLLQKIKAYEDSTSTQIAVLMLPSLQGKKIETVSVEIAQRLGIGQKGTNNGVLILIAKAEKKIRIEVGYGLEGALPDLESRRIMQDLMFPAIKKGSFYEALDKAIDRIIYLTKDELSPVARQKSSSPWLFTVGLVGLAALGLLLVVFIFTSRRAE